MREELRDTSGKQNWEGGKFRHELRIKWPQAFAYISSGCPGVCIASWELKNINMVMDKYMYCFMILNWFIMPIIKSLPMTPQAPEERDASSRSMNWFLNPPKKTWPKILWSLAQACPMTWCATCKISWCQCCGPTFLCGLQLQPKEFDGLPRLSICQ